jgi:hypothetical protein
MATIFLRHPIVPLTVERAHAMAVKAQEQQRQALADQAWEAARAKDAALLLALEKASEVLYQMEEAQMGRTKRSPDTQFSHTVDLTEPKMWQEAYRLADAGTPSRHLVWIYVAAGWLSGVVKGF